MTTRSDPTRCADCGKRTYKGAERCSQCRKRASITARRAVITCDCGASIDVREKRGPIPTVCRSCSKRRSALARRVEKTCRNSACGKLFLQDPTGAGFCSRTCAKRGIRYAEWDTSPRLCANPQCPDRRAAIGFEPKKEGQQFCSKRCARWQEFVTYSAAHDRVRNERGPAKNQTCVDCGKRAHQWSYNHADPDGQVEPDSGWPYSSKPEHYDPRCVKCHKAFDSS